MDELKDIVRKFETEGSPLNIVPLGNGNINDTFLVTTDSAAGVSYVLQRINNNVFKDVALLQHNIQAVTTHILRKLLEKGTTDVGRKVLTFCKVKDSDETYVEADGKFWRLSVYIDGSHVLSEVTPESARNAGVAFGEFQSMLVDMTDDLGETIPDFHNMELRARQFREAVSSDKAKRCKEVRDLIDFIEPRIHEMCRGERLVRNGDLPKRICHCDTKVNNMLFDKEGNFLCVIDLDTVMPSTIFSDYGDFLRTGACVVAEDEPDLDKVDFDLEVFKSFTEGYLSSAGSFLLPVERENLVFATKLFPFMQAVRFLTDYLNGDTYYKIAYPEHNLVRTKTQIRLFEKIEEKESSLRKILSEM